MDSTPSAPVPPRNRHPALRRAYVLFGSVFLALVLVLVLSPGANQQFTWMTPEQAARNLKPSPLTLLKYRVERALGPWMRYLHRNHPNIMITIKFMTLSPAASREINLGAPVATNTSGKCAWILPASELESFSRHVKTNSGASFFSIMTVETANGAQAAFSMSGDTGIRSRVDILPKISADGVTMLLQAYSIATITQQPSNGVGNKTNFFAACHALVPNAGSLLIDCGNTDPANPTNYWFILSPVLVDARGIPIKQ